AKFRAMLVRLCSKLQSDHSDQPARRLADRKRRLVFLPHPLANPLHKPFFGVLRGVRKRNSQSAAGNFLVGQVRDARALVSRRNGRKMEAAAEIDSMFAHSFSKKPLMQIRRPFNLSSSPSLNFL